MTKNCQNTQNMKDKTSEELSEVRGFKKFPLGSCSYRTKRRFYKLTPCMYFLNTVAEQGTNGESCCDVWINT